LGAVGVILGAAGIEHTYSKGEFGSCVIVTEFDKRIFIYDGTGLRGLDYGVTGPTRNGNETTFLNFDKDNIHTAGDLFLTLGHELHHAILDIYSPETDEITQEYIAYEWAYNIRTQLATPISWHMWNTISSRYYEYLWKKYGFPLKIKR
jgi:hypothetical protein